LSDPDNSRVRNRAWLLYLVFGACGGVCYYFVPPFAKSGPFFNVLGASSVAAILVGTRLHKPARRGPWFLFAAGQALFILGDVITYNYPRLFHTEIPFPSIGDVFYLSVYPCLIAGILLLIRHRTPGRDRDSLIDSAIVAIGLGLLSWEFLMAPYARDFTLTMLVKLTSMAYPFMDVLLLAVVARLALGVGRREPSFYLLVSASIALLATDAAYGMIQLSGVIYQNGGPLEAGWLTFYVLWGAAALHPSMRGMSEPASKRDRRFPQGRLLVLGGASLMAPAVQAVQALRGEPIETPVVLAGSVALFLLAIARMNGLVHRHELAEARERALREATASFVAAADLESLYRATIEAIRKMVGEGPDIRLSLAADPGGDLEIVAADGASSSNGRGQVVDLLALPRWMVTELDQGRSVELIGPEDAFLSALCVDPPAGAVLIAPLTIREGTDGLVVVGSENELPHEVQDGVSALAAQIGLAMESAILTEDLHRRKSEARFKTLVQNSSDVMTIIAPDTTVRYQSPSVNRVLGYVPEQLIGTKLLDAVHPDDAPRMVNILAEVADGRDGSGLLEFRWRHRDGTWLHVETLCSDLSDDPEVGGIVLNTRDVSERKVFEEQLEHQAFHDSITGLANRALFRDRVEHALERQQRDDRPISVLFMDIDDFKTINDSLGHAAGDQLLTVVGERVRRCLRAADTAARLGGDEFAVLLEDAGYGRAAEVAERIMKTLETPVHLGGKEVFVRASLGIAIGDEDRKGGRGVEELLRNADVAMYMAKSQGKGRYQVFEPEMHAAVLSRLELKADLQRAVEYGEFELFYQPVIVLETGRMSGVEALIRWRHPERGLVLPMEFIPLAEETGLIVRIGSWVLREACKEAATLQSKLPKDPPLTMSVNISARQLQHPGLTDDVRACLRSSALDPSSLIIEITETAMMQDAEMAIIRLNQLKDLGIKLAIDDFGTGYSSLNYLRRFPVDILKVDKSFIDEVSDGGEQSALTASIIKLAGTLQLLPVAEGIERAEQLDRLLELQCTLGQGFYFAEPLDVESVHRLVEGYSAEVPSAGVPGPGVAQG
jgi:diguanylate cyclase (GGDEF)-like protein/PAS domain S-box-containing protein